MVLIVRKLKFKHDTTKVEINDMRYAFCLTVAPTVMDATAIQVFGKKCIAMREYIYNNKKTIDKWHSLKQYI